MEEALKEITSAIRTDSAVNLGPVMARRLAEQARSVFYPAHPLVLCSEINTANSCKGDGSGTHCAGLERDEEITPDETLRPQTAACLSNREDFRMCRRVAPGQSTISGHGEHLSVRPRDDGADGNLAIGGCLLCCLEGQVHEGKGVDHTPCSSLYRCVVP